MSTNKLNSWNQYNKRPEKRDVNWIKTSTFSGECFTQGKYISGLYHDYQFQML